MRNLAWALGLAFFFLNPALACGVADPEYQYGADEMRAAVEGDWNLMIDAEGKSTAVTLRIEQDTQVRTAMAPAATQSLVSVAHACGTRTLVRAAGACGDSTEMPLVVTIVAGDPSLVATTGTGTFSVHSLTFGVGNLYLKVAGHQIEAQVDAQGIASAPRLLSVTDRGTVTIARVN